MMSVSDLRHLMPRFKPTVSCLAISLLLVRTADAQSPATVALVAGEVIRQTDVEYRLKVDQAYGNTSANAEAISVALVNEAVEREVAHQVGVQASPEEIGELAKHADATSQAPELLIQVKAIFGADQVSYQRLFLEPRITNGKLHDFQRFSPQLQGEQRKLIEKVQAGLKQGDSLQQAAKSAGLAAVASDIEDKPIELPDALKQLQSPSDAALKDPLIPLLEKLSAGEFIPNIIEDDSSYRIVRLTSKDQQRYRVETVRVDKAPFESWYKTQCAKVRVSFADSALEKRIAGNYPGLCWLGGH